MPREQPHKCWNMTVGAHPNMIPFISNQTQILFVTAKLSPSTSLPPLSLQLSLSQPECGSACFPKWGSRRNHFKKRTRYGRSQSSPPVLRLFFAVLFIVLVREKSQNSAFFFIQFLVSVSFIFVNFLQWSWNASCSVRRRIFVLNYSLLWSFENLITLLPCKYINLIFFEGFMVVVRRIC